MTTYRVNDTDYQFPDTMGEAEVKATLRRKGIISAPTGGSTPIPEEPGALKVLGGFLKGLNPLPSIDELKGLKSNFDQQSPIEKATSLAIPSSFIGKTFGEGAIQEAQKKSQEEFASGNPVLGVASSLPILGPPLIGMGEKVIGGAIEGDPTKVAEGIGEGTKFFALPKVAGRFAKAATSVHINPPPLAAAEGALPRMGATELGESLKTTTKVSKGLAEKAGSELYRPIDESGVGIPVGDLMSNPDFVETLSQLRSKDIPVGLSTLHDAISKGYGANLGGQNTYLDAIKKNAPPMTFSEAQALRGKLGRMQAAQGGGIRTPEQLAASKAYQALDSALENAVWKLSPELQATLDKADAFWLENVGELFRRGTPGAAIRAASEHPERLAGMLVPKNGPPPVTTATKVRAIIDRVMQDGSTDEKALAHGTLQGIQSNILHDYVLKSPEAGAGGALEGADARIAALGPIKQLFFGDSPILDQVAILAKQTTTPVAKLLSSFPANFFLYALGVPYRARLLMKALGLAGKMAPDAAPLQTLVKDYQMGTGTSLGIGTASSVPLAQPSPPPTSP